VPATYYVNVGVYTPGSKAKNTQTKLRKAGLPVVAQALDTNRGQRTRIRVGPYTTAQRADAAAAKVRTLALEAVVAQNKP